MAQTAGTILGIIVGVLVAIRIFSKKGNNGGRQ